jgi:uroporphyrinogen-III decarboxylase
MTGKDRVTSAMRHLPTDRVPVFCQLAIGHYMRRLDVEPSLIWYSPEVLSSAYIALAGEYGFDAVLVNLPGRPSDWKSHILSEERKEGKTLLQWDRGGYSVVPDNDNVHYHSEKALPTIEDLDPEKLFYIEPHNITEVKYPFYYDFGEHDAGALDESFFPPYILDTLKMTIEKAKGELHVSAEVFSPFTQLMELLGYSNALMALADYPEKCELILGKLVRGTAALGRLQLDAGADSILLSSAFAGGGFISRDYYERFVLRFEKAVIEELHAHAPAPVYVHTCGRIGDRIDLMQRAGYDGVDTMDPPPLGDTDIVKVKAAFGERLFLKGNVDPVHILLEGSPDEAFREADRLIKALGRGSGYILSSACSVSPAAPSENILALSEASRSNQASRG